MKEEKDIITKSSIRLQDTKSMHKIELHFYKLAINNLKNKIKKTIPLINTRLNFTLKITEQF